MNLSHNILPSCLHGRSTKWSGSSSVWGDCVQTSALHTSSNPLQYTFMINESTRAVILEYRYMCVGAWRFFYLLTVLHKLNICNILSLVSYSPPNLKKYPCYSIFRKKWDRQPNIATSEGRHWVIWGDIPTKKNTQVWSELSMDGAAAQIDIIVKTSLYCIFNFTLRAMYYQTVIWIMSIFDLIFLKEIFFVKFHIFACSPGANKLVM